MYLLNKIQVEIIIADVQQASITLSHLADDLVDHICCEVESLINEGKDFERAYEIVKKETGIEVLQKIQDNTNFLINKNYRFMKTTMKVTGNISLAILGIATVFKIMHWPGASIGFVLGFFLLSAIFFPIAVFTNYKYVSNKKNLFLHLAILIGGIGFMAGVLFKVQNWPGAGILLLIGYLALLLIFLPSLLFVKIKQTQSSKDKRIYILGIIAIIIYGLSNMFKMFHWPGASILMLTGALLLIGVFIPIFTWRRIQLEGKITGQFIFTIICSMFLILLTSLIALNMSKNVLNGFVNQANSTTLINNYLNKNNALLFSKIDSKNDSLELNSKAIIIKKLADDLDEYISNLQCELIMKSDGLNEMNSKELVGNVSGIIRKDNIEIVYLLLMGENNNGKAIELKDKISKYKTILLNDSLISNSEISSLLNLSDNKQDGQIITWEEQNFQGCYVIRAICILKFLQLKVNTVESVALNNLINKNNNL